MTATPARIRRCIRESEFASVSDAAVLAARPDAKDGNENVLESFFDFTSDAAVLLAERFAFQKKSRAHEAAEAATILSIGAGIPITPTLPQARMIDDTRDFDSSLIIRGLAIDFNTDRNSIEADG